MDSDDRLLQRFLRLRATVLSDCDNSDLPRFMVASILQSLAFELQAEVLGRDQRPGLNQSG